MQRNRRNTDAQPFYSARSSFDQISDPVIPQQTTAISYDYSASRDPEVSYHGGAHGRKPAWGWDYVFKFKIPRSIRNKLGTPNASTGDSPAVGREEDTDDKSEQRIRARIEILSRLKCAGFIFSQLLIPSQKCVLVRFSLPEPELKRKAELLGMELRLKPDFGGGYMAFSEERQETFVNESEGRERGCYFGPADRAIIMLNTLQSKEFWGCDLNIEQLVEDDTVLQAFALHSECEHAGLIQTAVWEQWWNPLWTPPLRDLKDYLGARISFYFVFVSFYAKSLVWIAIASIPTYVVFRTIDNIKAVTILRWVYAIFVVLWTTYFLEQWKRRSSTIGIKWGLNDFHHDISDDTRVQFRGKLRYGFYCEAGFVSLDDLVDEQRRDGADGLVNVEGAQKDGVSLPQNVYGNAQRGRNMLLQSAAITLLFVVVVSGVTFLLLWYRNNIVQYVTERWGNETVGKAAPGVLNGILITIFDAGWKVVALWLTRRENHRTNERFENSLIYKRFAFQFASNYVSLYYIAFVRPYLKNTCPTGRLTNQADCMLELENQLMSLVITKATLGQFMEIGIPLLTKLYRQWFARRQQTRHENEVEDRAEPDTAPQPGAPDTCTADNKYVEQSKLAAYESTMEDYAELVIQFGYLTLFGIAFPLASVVNLINNVIEVRSDAYKILVLSQRTNAEDAADIGAWYAILQVVNGLSVVTNVGLLVFTNDTLNVLADLDGRYGEDTGRKMLYRVVLFFCVEHLLLAMKGGAAFLIKDVPGKVRRVLARQTFDVARWFDRGWRESFRGRKRFSVDDEMVLRCERFGDEFDRDSNCN